MRREPCARSENSSVAASQQACLTLLDEGPLAQFAHRLLQFRLRVHDDRSVPGDRLFDRLARDEQEEDARIAGLHTMVANARREGFMGLSGERFSDAERAAIGEIAAALA